MALTQVAVNDLEENQSSLKVEGDLGSFEVVEEQSDYEDEESGSQVSRVSNSVSTLPPDFVKPSAPSVFGSVSVKHSENVQFGNNTYFNGPVTIKQIIQNSSEQDNLGFEQTEAETVPSQPQKADPNLISGLSAKPLQIQLWLKLTFSAVCVVIIGSICAIVSVTLLNSSQDNTSPTVFNEDGSTDCALVEGLCYDIRNVNLLILPIFMLLITCMWYSLSNFVMNKFLLTKDMVGDKPYIFGSKSKLKNKANNTEDDPLLIAPNHLRIVQRTDWLARPVEKPLDLLRQPVPWVIITHTDTESCSTQSECVLRVRLIQMFHVESRGWYDIGYNFLVAGDGSAYYGRGWDYEGAHTLGYNKYSIGIAFVGAFNSKAPPKKQIEACQKLIKRGVDLGKLAKDYKLFGHRQLASTLSPGDKLYDIIKEWPHFVKNDSDIAALLPNY